MGWLTVFPPKGGKAFVFIGIFWVCLGAISPSVWGASGARAVQEALQGLDQWLEGSPYKDGWMEYLQTPRLQRQLAQPEQADPHQLAEILARYYSEAEGLELAPFVQVREALRDWLAEITGTSWAGLARQTKASQTAFIPFGPQTHQRVYRRLKEAVAALDRRLQLAGPNGQAWREYLDWQELIAQLARGPKADPERLDALYYKFDAGFEGLGLYWFREVRRALLEWVIVLRATSPAQLQGHYRAVLDSLAQQLQSLGPTPTSQQMFQLEEILAWLRDARQAPWLIENIRRRFGQPNLKLTLSPCLVQAAMDRPVEDVSPVVDWILGTQIYGTGRTEGSITTQLIPNSQAAEVLLHFTGRTHSETVGYNGPARIYADGHTILQAKKTIRISPEGLQSTSTLAQADTQTRIRGIRLVRGGCLVERIAWKRTWQTKSSAEWIAARHAEQRLARRLDEQLDSLLAEKNRDFLHRIRQPLWERRLWPPEVRLRSTDRTVELEVCQAQAVQLAAPCPPPSLKCPADLTLQIHETMINNTAASAVAGMIITDEHFSRAAQQPGPLGQFFQQAPTQPEGEPWALYFAHQRPVWVCFRDGKFTITIRGRAFRRGETHYPGMDITAEYRIEKSPSGYRALREEKLKIFPPDFQPGRQLSVQEQILKDLLHRRFEKIFPPELIPEPIQLPENWPSPGSLQLTHWETRDGWLSMAWQYCPRASSASAK